MRLNGTPLAFLSDVTIQGPGAASILISGENQSQVFTVASGRTVTISGVTVTAGKTSDGTAGATGATATTGTGNQNGGPGGAGGAGGNSAFGGGIANAGTLTLINVVVSGNHTGTGGTGGVGGATGPGGMQSGTGGPGGPGGFSGFGGGIYNNGTLTLIGCTVSGNVTGACRNGQCLDPDARSDRETVPEGILRIALGSPILRLMAAPHPVSPQRKDEQPPLPTHLLIPARAQEDNGDRTQYDPYGPGPNGSDHACCATPHRSASLSVQRFARRAEVTSHQARAGSGTGRAPERGIRHI